MASAPTTTDFGGAAPAAPSSRCSSCEHALGPMCKHRPYFLLLGTKLCMKQLSCRPRVMQRSVRLLISASMVAGTALTAPTASACTIYQSARDRAKGPFDSVVVGRVVQARNNGSPSDESRAWSATVIIGERIADRMFSVFSHHDDCGERLKMPKVGDAWVLYIKRRNGSAVLFHAMPLAQARKEDPRFGGPAYPAAAKQRRLAEEIRRIDALVAALKAQSSESRSGP